MSSVINDELRIARLEAVCENIREQLYDAMTSAYEKAKEDQDEETASDLVKKIRDFLLSNSDKEVVLDRLIPDAPSGTTFAAWLAWLKSFSSIKDSPWAISRQQLRDITKQPGFPFNIEFPEKPE